jgi:LuxR family maltose regulon positive regulatory protein
MAPVLLGSKLHPPVLAGHLIARPQLLDLLDRGSNARLILVSSPAGTGKSTSLAAWLRRQGRPAAWLSLDKGDDSLGQFLLYLVSALQTLGLGLGEGLPELLRQQHVVNVEPLLIQLSNDFARLGDNILLVLDDYHFLSDPKIHGAVEFLLDHLPPQVCLVIATRTDPPLSLSRLRVQSQLLEVRAHDLRFDLAEATHFLNGSQKLDLSPTAIASLEVQTEGWIAALQLAALSLADRPDKEAFVETFVGSHRFLVDYLVDEVLSRQPAAVKTFLQRTAILERFDASLCEAVTGHPADADLLMRLEAANLFLIPLDDERRWYRFHHLFGEFLRHRLRADEPDLTPELHRRASAWFAREGWTDDAIRHAFLADDDHLAARLADDTAVKLALHWSSEQFNRFFRQLPPALLPLHPRLCLYYCWFLVTTGQLGTLKTTLPLLEKSKAHSSEPRTIDAAVFGLQAYERFRQLDFATATQLCQQELSLLEPAVQGSSSVEAQLVRIGGINLLASICLHNNPRQAAALYSVSLTLSRQFGSSISVANGTVGLARAHHQLGQLHEAAKVLKQGLAHLEAGNSDRAVSLRAGNVGELHVRVGSVSYEWNQLGEAEAAIRRAGRSNELYGSPGVLALELELSLRLFLARGEPEAAYTALHRLDQLSAGVHRDDQLLKQTFEGLAMKCRLALAAYATQSDVAQPGAGQPGASRSEQLLDEVASWLAPRKLDGTAVSPSSLGGHDVLARWLLARNEPTEAVLLLERLIAAAQSEERVDDLIQFLLLHALALQSLNRGEEAMQALLRALDLGESEGYCRSFVDLGPGMQALLTQRAGTRPTPYLTALLGAFPDSGHPPATSSELRKDPALRKDSGLRQGTGEPQSQGGEAFSAREMAVLRLLEVGHTHKQVARELELSPNTVRWYMKSLYLKLQVNNRTEALNRARDIGLV